MSRAFADVIRELAGGVTYQSLTDHLAEVVQAVMETRKSGEVSLKLKIKCNGETSIIITDEVKAKVPQENRGETVFFATSAGHLLKDDPRQEKLPLREVKDAGPMPLKDVGA